MQNNTLIQKQQFKQTALQTVQLMHLVELSTTTLEQEIIKEVEENPALEIDHETDFLVEESQQPERENNIDIFEDFYDKDEYDCYDDYQLYNTNRSKEDTCYFPAAPYNSSFQEILLLQLRDFDLSKKNTMLAEYLIGCLDENGYLSMAIDNIVMDLLLVYNIRVTYLEVENILTNVIQQFDPVGIGSRNIQECLTIQINLKKETSTVSLARKILNEHFEIFSKKQYEKLQLLLHINAETLKKAIDEILLLNPYPIFSLISSDNKSIQITPDFIITNEEGKLILNLNNYHIPKLKINQEFKNQFSFHNLHLSKEKQREAEQFIKENVTQAKSFIGTLNLRELVLYNTMYAIMDIQRAYFLSGDDKDLKPMILKDIAKKVHLDISTVSRVSNSKYVQTPFGTISLKHLFSESIGNKEVSSKEVKSIISELIENENKTKPLSDELLCTKLKEKGYDIARRTVAKYREQIEIPIARMRKEI